MTLTFVKPESTPWVNVLLYGNPKSGKTTAACSAPGGLLLLNCDLPNATRYAHSRDLDSRIMEVEMTGLSTLTDITHVVREQAGEARIVDTVVVDPVGELHRRLLEEASNRAVRPTLPQYGDVVTYVERFCRMLCEAPVNVVLVCHERATKDEATGAIERLPNTGTTNPALGEKLMGMVDIIGYTGMVEESDGTKRYIAQLINDKGRRGGDRFAVLGDWRELDLSEWFARAAGVKDEITQSETTTEAIAA